MKKINIKLFADGADIGKMYELYVNGTVKGFTTNPTLIKKAGVIDYMTFARKVVELMPDVPISFEVLSDDMNEMVKQALELNKIGNNIYIKIPIMNVRGYPTYSVIAYLTHRGVKVNITAVMKYEQVERVISFIDKKTPCIISVFAGRIADTGRDPMRIVKSCKHEIIHNSNIELLWASSRELYNIMQAEACGCDIITVTPEILNKLSMIDKDLDDLTLDTVKMFYDDAAGYQIK